MEDDLIEKAVQQLYFIEIFKSLKYLSAACLQSMETIKCEDIQDFKGEKTIYIIYIV